MTSAIVFEKLILQGFGPYREATTFTFTPGVNGYIAANETGKTSMMAGLLATIFGLTHRRRGASAFNLERFRNWDQPAACRGELFLSSAGRRYQLQRDFDTHQVALWELSDGLAPLRLVVEGQHNPEARKPLRSYEEAVHRILGISRQELFETTFFVAQPLPEVSQISAGLQSLLAGSKGASFQGAQAGLLAKLKNLTKYTGPNQRGITPRNMSKEGAIEQQLEKIQALQEQISAGQQAADSLIDVQLKVRAVEEELSQARRALEQNNNTRQAWSGWQLLASQYAAAVKERANLDSAIIEVNKLTNELAELEKALQAQYPEFANAGPELAEGLEKLIYLNQEISKATEAANNWQDSRQQQQERQAKLTASIEKYRDWELLGADPAEKIRGTRRTAATCLKSWANFQSDRNKLTAVNRRLANSYGLFNSATASELATISNIGQTRNTLAAETDKAGQAYASAEQKIKTWEDAQREHFAKFSDLRELPAQAAEAAAAKWQLLKKQRELEKQLRELVAPFPIPVGACLAGGAVIAAAAFFLLGTGNPVMLVMGLVIAFLIGAASVGLFYAKTKVAPDSKHQAVLRELARLKEQVAEYDRQLGSFARADDLELARLVERLKLYAEEERRLKTIENELAAIDLTVLKQRLLDKKEDLAIFQRSINKFTDAYADVQAAYQEWKDLAGEQQRLATAVDRFAEAAFGCRAEAADSAELNSAGTDEQWRELAAVLQAILEEKSTESINSTSALVNQLAELTDDWWQEREAEAAQLIILKKEQETLRHQLATTGKLIEVEKGKIARLQQEQRSWQEKLGPVLQANGNNPEQALRQYKKRLEQVKLKNDANTKLETLLNNYQVAGIDRLVAKYQLANDEVTSRMLQWQQHTDKFPGLPVPNQAGDPGIVEQKMRETEETIQAIGENISVLENQRSELYRRLARLEGVNPVNIAAAEVEVQELKTEQSRLELQADALALAYRELGAAITEYQQTYQKRLEDTATAYCRGISSTHERQIVLDDRFNLGIKESGRSVTMESLSKGARDQVYLSLRFAIADLLAEEAKLPLIFDDPFTSTDAARLARIKAILESQAPERQFFILAHADHYSGWGKAIDIS